MLDVLGGSGSLPKQRRKPSFKLQEWQKSTPADFKRFKTRIPTYPYQSVDDIDLHGGLQKRRESFMLEMDKDTNVSELCVRVPNSVKDLFAFSPYRHVDNIEGGKDGGSPPKYMEPFLSRSRGDTMSWNTALPPQNVDDINVMGGLQERRMSFLAPNEANVVNTAKKCEKKVLPSPATGRSRLDSLMGDGHMSRKEGGSGTSNTAVLPRVKSFRTELDLFSINFAGQNAACIPSMEEFKDNPFELDVNDLVDECVSPESDENFLNSPRSSSAVATLPQMEMQQQQQREGDNNNDGSNCDTSNSNPVFSLKERSMGGGNDDSKKRGRIKTDEMKMGPTPIVTDPEIHIPVNVWQPIEKELGKDMKITAAAYGMCVTLLQHVGLELKDMVLLYDHETLLFVSNNNFITLFYYAGIPEQQTGTQPVQEGTNEQQSSIVMGINSLSFLFDSPCFSVLELDECIKSFSPPIQTGWRTLDVVGLSFRKYI